MKFYQYPSCGSCREAKTWLKERGELERAQQVHLVEQTPSKEALRALWQKSELPLKRFFNTSGGSYRALDLKNTYADYSDEQRLDLLAADGMLIKRPLLETEQGVCVGFKQEQWAAALGEV